MGSLALAGSSLYIGGIFTHYGDASAVALAKVDSGSGVLDTAFTQPQGLALSSGLAARVEAVAVSGGALFVGGTFSTYRGQAAVALAKLDAATGAIDATFTQSGGFLDSAGVFLSALAATPNSLYIAGHFTSYRGALAFDLAKLDTQSGARDAAFARFAGVQIPSRGFNQLVLAGNALYVGGTVVDYSGLASSAVAKLDAASGAFDATFAQVTDVVAAVSPYGPFVRSLLVEGSSLVVGGTFQLTAPGTTNMANDLAKFDLVTGMLDTGFSLPAGPNDAVAALCAVNGRFYVGGDFTTYRGVPASYLIRSIRCRASTRILDGVIAGSLTLSAKRDAKAEARDCGHGFFDS